MAHWLSNRYIYTGKFSMFSLCHTSQSQILETFFNLPSWFSAYPLKCLDVCMCVRACARARVDVCELHMLVRAAS